MVTNIIVCLKFLVIEKRSKKGIEYPNLSSAIRSVPHGPDIPLPTPPTTLSDAEWERSATSSSSNEMCLQTT